MAEQIHCYGIETQSISGEGTQPYPRLIHSAPFCQPMPGICENLIPNHHQLEELQQQEAPMQGRTWVSTLLAWPTHIWAEKRPNCQPVPQINIREGGCASLLQNPLKPHSLCVLLSVTTTSCQLCRGKCSAQHWWLIRGLHKMPLPNGSPSTCWGTGRAGVQQLHGLITLLSHQHPFSF